MKFFALTAIAAACLFTAPAGASYRHSHASHSYYRSSDGSRIHGPDYSRRNVAAHCADGTLSHSHHAQGTCSHHGGVEHWD